MTVSGRIQVWRREAKDATEWALLTSEERDKNQFYGSYQLVNGGLFTVGPFATRDDAVRAAEQALERLGFANAARS